MKNATVTTIVLLLSSVVGTLPLEAHGGLFRPPPPPPYDGPGGSGVGQGGGGGGASTPVPGGPARPSAPAPAPATPSPASPGGAGSPITRVGGAQPDLSDWSLWWGFNSDPYLGLREIVRSAGPLTGSDEFFLGQGASEKLRTSGPQEAAIREKVGPALQRAIESESSDRVLCDAMIALAKLHPVYAPSGVRSMSELFTPHLDHPNQKVVESAIVALGLMADSTCTPALCSLAADGAVGRKLLGRVKVPLPTRALAALALGVVGANSEREDERRYVAHTLVQILEGERQASPDLFVSCVTALGLTSLAESRVPARNGGEERSVASSSRQGLIRFLTDLLHDEDRHRFVRAHAPVALARLVRGVDDPERAGVARALLDVLGGGEKVGRLVRYGIVEGLAAIGDSDADAVDAEIREVLRESVRRGDSFQRQLSVLAIAQVSSRPGTGAGESLEGAREGRAFLVEQLTRGKRRTRPWAALGLGLFGHHLREGGRELDEATSKGLSQTLSGVGSPSDSGAWYIALGLRGDVAAAPALLGRLESTRDDAARGRAAIALGLLGAREAIPALEKIVRESRYRPALLRDSAIALALLGDKRVVVHLLEIMSSTDSVAIQSAVVGALAFIGDARVIDPLVELLEDPERPDIARDFAAIALGVACERGRLPWTASFANHLTYAAATDALISGKGSGILNLR